MIPLKFAYLTGSLLFFIPWGLLYWHRKDLRKEMVIMGVIGAIGMLVTQYAWTVDWWRPQTITGTRIGIEDAFLGFNNAGIAAVLYEEIFRKSLYKRNLKKHQEGIVLLVALTCLLFIILFLGLQVTSFTACIIALSVFCAILIYFRKDLFISSLINGLLMVILVLPIYYSIMFLSPGVIENTYLFASLSKLRITGIPIEELIFYYVFGFMVTLMYEYWQGVRLRKLANKNYYKKKK